MSEFTDAIAWRGPAHLSFIVYGIWERGSIAPVAAEVARQLQLRAPGLEISAFVATAEDWPCDIGVFDAEGSQWPEELESFCNSLLSALGDNGARLSWMMFDGVFNDADDIFCAEWASQVYAIRGDGDADDFVTAFVDVDRHSSAWKQTVLGYRGRLLSMYPALRSP